MAKKEYRDIHNSSKGVKKYLEMIKGLDMSKKQKQDIKRFVKELRLGKIGKKVGDRRIKSYLQFLVKLHRYFEKDLDKITEKQAEKFYQDLEEDKIRKQNGEPYAVSSKGEWIRTLKRFLGWKWGKETRKYKNRLSWMKKDKKKSEKNAINLDKAEKIVKKSNKIRNKALFMFLFDSGARIEEALNIRFSDLKTNEKGKEKYYMVHIRGQKTKTSDRTIAIPLCSKYLNKWFKKLKPNEDTFIFPLKYDNVRRIIRKMSKKVLKFSLKPHELRHSSATHYIQHGGFGAKNIGGFYYRYGWKFGSKEALRYIKQYMYGGELGQNKVVKNIVSGKIEKLEEEIDKLKKQRKKEKKQMLKVFQQHLFKYFKEVGIDVKDLPKLTKG